ncbi:MAG: hypothetical protein COA44_15205 [Arcobacter sp.]|nr:MAG: hypothetical protein COA44_15205 [Arcobacter sp.]
MKENYNIETERAVLNSILFNPAQLHKVKKDLLDETFFYQPHKELYKVFTHLDESGRAIEETFIKKELQKRNQFNEDFMLDLMTANPISNIKNYIVDLQDYHKNREVHDATVRFQKGEIDTLKLSSLINKSEQLYKQDETVKKKEREYKHLTPYMKAMLADLKKVNNQPDSMIWSVMLASMGGLIGSRAKITNSINLTVYPVIWAMIVAPSSLAAKSTLYRHTKECVFGDIQELFYEEFEEKNKNFEELYKRYMALGKEDKLEENEPQEPILSQVVFHSGGTPEAKLKSLNENQNGGIVYYDEMKAELEATNSKPDYKALKTSIFDGETFHKQLVKGGTLILKRPALSEVGLITKPWLLEAAQINDVASGFMARYLFSVNERQDFQPLQINESLRPETDKYIKVGKFVMDMLGFSREEPVTFRLSASARKKHKEWFNDYSKSVYATETDEEATASYRLSTYVLKFALISYVFNNAYKILDVVASDQLEVGEEYLDEALEIMELFSNESHKLLQLFEKSEKLNFRLDDAVIKLYKKIDKEPTKMVTRSQALNIRGIDKDILDNMIEIGQVISIKGDDGKKVFITKP